ncbi:hypothetical protein FHR32_004060 [Streptosporangium album]|uniref:Uncharacterized protein n=1 Tax=Streptosporangium album TaxID=47479 RepID=A0A7W7RX32_9ACTN|nr:hypothetical protein [Streptosporangium album]MBB4939755.1 hypothetical protein [Streptosporangium album]
MLTSALAGGVASTDGPLRAQPDLTPAKIQATASAPSSLESTPVIASAVSVSNRECETGCERAAVDRQDSAVDAPPPPDTCGPGGP